MTPEGKVKKQVRELLAKYKCYVNWPVPYGYGVPTLDVIGCIRGEFFAVEAKAEGKKPTPRQDITIAAIRNAGGRVFIVDGDLSELEEYLNSQSARVYHLT